MYKLPIKYNTLDWRKGEKALVREQYIKEQNGLCYYCKQDLTKEPPKYIKDKKINWDRFPNGFMKSPIHLQHCHKSGLTEGAVHAYCNAVMFQYEGR